MKNSLSKVQFCYFRLSCRIKNLYQMVKKAADKCKYLAKYIYVKHSLRKNRGGAGKKVKVPVALLSHPVLAVSRKLSSFNSYDNTVCGINTTVCLCAFLILNYTNYSDMKGNDLTQEEKNV